MFSQLEVIEVKYIFNYQNNRKIKNNRKTHTELIRFIRLSNVMAKNSTPFVTFKEFFKYLNYI